MNRQLGGGRVARASPASVIALARLDRDGQKSGRPLTPKRPAFAFLVTPKLPAKRGEVLNLVKSDRVFSWIVKREVAKSTTFLLKDLYNVIYYS
jgi:hypothetical protein